MDATIQQFLKNGLGSLVRWLMVFVGAWLVKKGYISGEQGEAVVSQGTAWGVGLLMALGGLAWSVWQKWHSNKKVDKALDMPQGTPRALLEKKVDQQGV